MVLSFLPLWKICWNKISVDKESSEKTVKAVIGWTVNYNFIILLLFFFYEWFKALANNKNSNQEKCTYVLTCI